MQTLELKKFGTPELYKMGLVEMNTEEQQVIEGGFLDALLGALTVVAAIVTAVVKIVEGINKIDEIINKPPSGGGGGTSKNGMIRYSAY